MDAPLKVIGFDHLVINTADAERALRFYCDDLGLQPVRVDEWRSGRAPFPSVRVDETTIVDLLPAPPTGVNADHFCLVVDRTDFDVIAASGRFEVLAGPGQRFGAMGTGTSLYVRDPDGNTVELRYY